MDSFNINFNNLLPHAIAAFTAVYGDEYYSTISKRVNSAIIVQYHDINELKRYIQNLKWCKQQEYYVKFLNKIGVDVHNIGNIDYTKPFEFSSEIKSLLSAYISISEGFGENVDFWAPLRAFNDNNNADSNMLKRNKIKILNYMRGYVDEIITEDNLDDFTKTNEYAELLKRINGLNIIYEGLLSEYKQWETMLLPYEELLETEAKRQYDIFEKIKEEIFTEIFQKLPLPVKAAISNKTFEEQVHAIIPFDISEASLIESFHSENMAKLKSPTVELNVKKGIMYRQSIYLRNLGIDTPVRITQCTEEDVNNHLSLLSQEDVKKYIPTDELINYISFIREKKYKEYWLTKKDVKEALKLSNNPYIYQVIKNRQICVLGKGVNRNDSEFISTMLYTIRGNDVGALFNTFLHEIGHVIDDSPKGCGFESSDDFEENAKLNPYDNRYRKYEKFNETLSDIFTMEAYKFLLGQGIYLIEPKELTLLDTTERNTGSIVKKVLQPLLQKFREQAVKAKVNTEPEELIKYIGKDNFEELVDVVNKVDYLWRKGVASKIEKFPEDPMVIEYFKQIKRLEEIYINIDDYYANNFGTSSLDGLGEAKKSR